MGKEIKELIKEKGNKVQTGTELPGIGRNRKKIVNNKGK